MTPAEQIASALNLRQTKPGQHRGRCPCHESASGSSLVVWESTDDDGEPKAGIHDWGGCEAAQVLGTAGLTLVHLYAKNWDRPPLPIAAPSRRNPRPKRV